MASEYKPNLVVRSITANTTVSDFDAGTTLTLNSATGATVTLPAATGSGAALDVVVGTTLSSGSYKVQVTGSDVIQGAVIVATDTGGLTVPTASTSDTITMNGSTTGGVIGSNVRLIDVKSGIWAVSGALVSTGDEATPFSAAVT